MQYEELTDAELIARCREGDQAAWSTLVRRYQRLIYTVPRRAGLSEEHAADVFQSCFEKLYQHIDRIEDAERVRAARALGLHVLPWTVNEAADMDRLIAWGVDGIVSDYPDRLRAAVHRAGRPLPPAGAK